MAGPGPEGQKDSSLLQYAQALHAEANRQTDLFSQDLQKGLTQHHIPIRRIMVQAMTITADNDFYTKADVVVILDKTEEGGLTLARKVQQVSGSLIRAAGGNDEFAIIPLYSDSTGALEPDHYFPGYRTVFPGLGS